MSRSKPRQRHSPRPAGERWCIVGLGSATVGTAAASGQPIRFAEPVVYAGTGRPGLVATADLDADASIDVAVTGDNAIQIFFNDGAGSLMLETTIPYERDIQSLTAADMDGDGAIDLLWFERLNDFSYTLSVWYNEGNGRVGQLARMPLAAFEESAGFVVGDVSGDGLNDVVFATDPLKIGAFINLGNRAFGQQAVFQYDRTQFELRTFRLGDLDGDGDTDIVAVFQYVDRSSRYYDVKGTQVAILLNDGSFPLRVASETELPWQQADILALDMTTGDLDGDGDLDAAIGGTSYGRSLSWSEFAILRNDSGTSLSPVADFQVAPPFPGAMQLADIDTDGRLDLVFRTFRIQGVYVFRNEGGFQFTGLSPFYTSFSLGLAVADLTGDGQYDLIHAGTTGFSVLENITDLRGPLLAVSPLRRGREAAFLVRRANPGEEVHFLYSLAGVGNTVGQGLLGGITLDLPDAVLLGSALAQADGRAVLRRVVPPGAPLVPLGVQAVIRRGPGGRDSVKTPFHLGLIED